MARVRAAAAVGYAGVGLFVGAWARLREDPAELDRLDAALDETGLVIANIDTIAGWAGADIERARRIEALAHEIADRYGCRSVQAIGDPPGPLDVGATARRFAGVCDRAADHGLDVALEWVPQMTNVPTASDARRVVEAADRPNAGFCFDAWHLTRSTNDPGELRSLPGERIVAAQWNDGPIEPEVADYYTDTTTNRRPPGEGQFRLTEMVRVLDEIGCRAPTSLEVHSKELYAAPIDEAARVSADGMRAVRERARG